MANDFAGLRQVCFSGQLLAYGGTMKKVKIQPGCLLMSEIGAQLTARYHINKPVSSPIVGDPNYWYAMNYLSAKI